MMKNDTFGNENFDQTDEIANNSNSDGKIDSQFAIESQTISLNRDSMVVEEGSQESERKEGYRAPGD